MAPRPTLADETIVCRGGPYTVHASAVGYPSLISITFKRSLVAVGGNYGLLAPAQCGWPSRAFRDDEPDDLCDKSPFQVDWQYSGADAKLTHIWSPPSPAYLNGLGNSSRTFALTVHRVGPCFLITGTPMVPIKTTLPAIPDLLMPLPSPSPSPFILLIPPAATAAPTP